MPELNLSYAPLPPWLQQPEGNTEFSNLLAATQSARQERQISAQERELPYRIKSLQQEQMLNDLKLGEAVRQRDQLLDVEASMQALSSNVAPLFKNHQPVQALNTILSWGVEDPLRLKHPAYQNLLKEARASVELENARLQLQNETRRVQSQEIRDRAQAEKDLAEATDLQLGVGAPVAPTARQKEIDAYFTARNSGDTERAELLLMGLQEKGWQIERLPDGTEKISFGPMKAGSEGPTVATQTRASERITSAENALFSLNKSLESLSSNPTATGPLGVTLEAFETLKGWINPNAPVSQFPITGARNQLRETANTLIPMLKADSQMSNYERRKLESLTDQTDVTATTPAAKDSLQRIQDAAVARALREIKNNAPGRDPSESLLRAIRTEAEAIALNQEGLLSRKDAVRWRNLRKQDTSP